MREWSIEMMSTAQELMMWSGADGIRAPEAVIPPGRGDASTTVTFRPARAR